MLHFALCCLIMTGLLGACADKKSFGGTAAHTEMSPEQKALLAERCSQNAIGVTDAKLVSDGLSQKLDNQAMRFELSMLICKDAHIASLQNQSIFFDLDLEATRTRSLSYHIHSLQGEALSEGILSKVQGRDLFGNTGEFYHWQTGNLNFARAEQRLVLTIELNGFMVKRRSSAAAAASYLKIGDAEPVLTEISWLD